MFQANAMVAQIGYPSYILNDTVLNDEYKHVSNLGNDEQT